MATIPRRDALAAGAALVLTECVGSSDEAVPAVRDDAATIAAWIEQHRSNLPTDYDDLGLLPFPYRREIALCLSSVEKSALVQEHLRRAIAARPRLTDEQRAVLAEAPRYVTPEWAEASTDAREAMYPNGGWWQRAKEVFCTEEWRRIFGQSDAVNLWCLGRFLSFEDCARAVGW